MKLFVSIPPTVNAWKRFMTEEARAYLEERFDVSYLPLDRLPKPEEVIRYAQDAEILMTGWGHPMIDAAMLEKTSIKLIAHTGGSVADYVAPDVYEMGIKVISGNDLYAESVAEGTVGYMMLALRKLVDYVDDTRAGNWHSERCAPAEGLLDQTVGLVGMGAITKNLIPMLKPFRAKLKLYSGYPIDPEYLEENNAVQASLEEIFSTCKVVSIHSSLNDRTRGMIGKEHFDLLQDGAVFVNTARGAIIREEEMIEALKENRFMAVLDVYCKEPLDLDSPLRSLKNVYCIPHQGGPTSDRTPVVTMRLADDILRFAAGKPLRYEISGEYAKRMTKQRS
jgi:phosphoglycerate dehydrogenase-like enzyme